MERSTNNCCIVLYCVHSASINALPFSRPWIGHRRPECTTTSAADTMGKSTSHAAAAAAVAAAAVAAAAAAANSPQVCKRYPGEPPANSRVPLSRLRCVSRETNYRVPCVAVFKHPRRMHYWERHRNAFRSCIWSSFEKRRLFCHCSRAGTEPERAAVVNLFLLNSSECSTISNEVSSTQKVGGGLFWGQRKIVRSSFTVVNLQDLWSNYARSKCHVIDLVYEKWGGGTWGQAQILGVLCSWLPCPPVESLLTISTN